MLETLREASCAIPIADQIVEAEAIRSGLTPPQSEQLKQYFQASADLDALLIFESRIPRDFLDQRIRELEEVKAKICEDPALCDAFSRCRQNVNDAVYENEP